MNEKKPDSNEEKKPVNTTSEVAELEKLTSVDKTDQDQTIWMRLLFMLVVAMCYSVSRFVVGVVVVMQFFWVLLTGRTNIKLQLFGKALSSYTYQILLYLTFNTEERPFPFDKEWPDAQ